LRNQFIPSRSVAGSRRQQAIGRYHLTVMRRGAQATSRADGKQKENKNVTVISDSRLPDAQGRCRPVLPGLKPESQNSVAMASTFDSRCALHANLTWALILRVWSAEDCDASVPLEKHSVWSSRHTTTRENRRGLDCVRNYELRISPPKTPELTEAT
jgi:hypothetical protein